MAVLSDASELLVLPKDGDLLGISGHTDTGTVVITSCSRKITTLSVADHRIIKDWSVKTSQHLSCPVTLDHRNGLYLCILNEQTLRIWKEDDLAIDKAARISLPKPAERVLSWLGHQPIIVYRDGSLSLLDTVSDIHGRVQLSHSIAWCGSHIIADVPYIVVVVKTQNDQQLVVHTYQLTTDDQLTTLTECVLSIPESCEAKDFCIQCRGSGCQLLTLLSSGQMLRTEVTDGSTEVLHHIPGVCGTTAAIVALDDCHIALAGIRSSTSGHQEGIGIWDSKFNLLKAWRPYPQQHSTPKQVYNIGGHLLTTCGKALYVLSYNVSASTLLAVLGRHTKLPDLFTPPPDNSEEQENSQLCTDSEILELVDPKKTPSLKQFQMCFKNFINWCQSHKGERLVVGQHVNRLLARCVAEKQFWPGDELMELVKTGVIQGSQCEVLVKALTQHGELGHVHTALQQTPDVPESVLVHCLDFYLSLPEEKFPTAVRDEDSTQLSTVELKCPIDRNKAAFINQVLVSTYNDIFLLQNIRKMDFSRSLELLRYLLWLVHVSSSGVPSGGKIKQPVSLIQTVDWISMLIDAHFTQMVLACEAHSVLLELHQTVLSQMQYYEELVSLEALLTQLKDCSTPPSKQNMGSYCIETLHIY